MILRRVGALLERERVPGLAGIFLFAVLGTVEALTVYGLLELQLLPGPWLLLIVGVLGLVTVLAYRLLHGRRRWLRVLGGTVSLAATAGCMLLVMGAAMVDSAMGLVAQGPEYQAPPYETPAPFVVYLSGSDTRAGTLKKSRSDLNILAVVDPAGERVLLVNTPRDYYIPNPAGSGARDKLTHCSLYGVTNSAKALGQLYDVTVDYTAQINFKGFETLIDALGGITVQSDRAFTTSVGGYPIVAGDNHLNGAQALAFARERARLTDGDNGRGRNQMQVVTAMIRKVTDGTLLRNWGAVLRSLEGMFTTDIPVRLMTAMIRLQLWENPDWQVETLSVTGRDGSAGTYSTGRTKVYVMYPDETAVETASQRIRAYVGEEEK